ncbi:hypothetical protein BCR39DRAFT_199712 [Naematelia encephala]|uniref:Uncharacterized protein n=1 Tax=Naematelia encephala TaxID=71784 RepID=A0A1Y2B1A6_9TREE|nr:hypothetical protein BCR39DRAFT_199712 [Naematelia encephala]
MEGSMPLNSSASNAQNLNKNNNSVPTNSVPSNSIPSSSAPNSSVPSNSAPSSSVPSSSAPSNSLPNGGSNGSGTAKSERTAQSDVKRYENTQTEKVNNGDAKIAGGGKSVQTTDGDVKTDGIGKTIKAVKGDMNNTSNGQPVKTFNADTREEANNKTGKTLNGDMKNAKTDTNEAQLNKGVIDLQKSDAGTAVKDSSVSALPGTTNSGKTGVVDVKTNKLGAHVVQTPGKDTTATDTELSDGKPEHTVDTKVQVPTEDSALGPQHGTTNGKLGAPLKSGNGNTLPGSGTTNAPIPQVAAGYNNNNNNNEQHNQHDQHDYKEGSRLSQSSNSNLNPSPSSTAPKKDAASPHHPISSAPPSSPHRSSAPSPPYKSHAASHNGSKAATKANQNQGSSSSNGHSQSKIKTHNQVNVKAGKNNKVGVQNDTGNVSAQGNSENRIQSSNTKSGSDIIHGALDAARISRTGPNRLSQDISTREQLINESATHKYTPYSASFGSRPAYLEPCDGVYTHADDDLVDMCMDSNMLQFQPQHTVRCPDSMQHDIHVHESSTGTNKETMNTKASKDVAQYLRLCMDAGTL